MSANGMVGELRAWDRLAVVASGDPSVFADTPEVGSGSPERAVTNTTTPAPSPSPMMNAAINLATTENPASLVHGILLP